MINNNLHAAPLARYCRGVPISHRGKIRLLVQRLWMRRETSAAPLRPSREATSGERRRAINVGRRSRPGRQPKAWGEFAGRTVIRSRCGPEDGCNGCGNVAAELPLQGGVVENEVRRGCTHVLGSSDRGPCAAGLVPCRGTAVRVEGARRGARRRRHGAEAEPNHQEEQHAERTHGKGDRASSCTKVKGATPENPYSCPIML